MTTEEQPAQGQQEPQRFRPIRALPRSAMYAAYCMTVSCGDYSRECITHGPVEVWMTDHEQKTGHRHFQRLQTYAQELIPVGGQTYRLAGND